MSRWFRVYDDLVNDPKVQRLPAETFRGLVNLWCLASRGGGALPSIDDIAFALRMDPDKAARLLSDLRLAGLIDDGEDGAAKPHKWDTRQFKSDVSNERVKRYRERHCNATEAVTVTPPDTDTDTDTDTEKKEEVSPAEVSGGDGATPIEPILPKKKPTPKAQASVMPAGWEPTGDGMAYGVELLGSDEASRQLLIIRDWAESGGHRKASWEATWRNWVRRASMDGPRAPPRQATGNGYASLLRKLEDQTNATNSARHVRHEIALGDSSVNDIPPRRRLGF